MGGGSKEKEEREQRKNGRCENVSTYAFFTCTKKIHFPSTKSAGRTFASPTMTKGAEAG